MSRTVREILNEGQIGKLPDAEHQLGLGDAVALTPAFLASAVTADAIALPENAKAAQLLSVLVTAGASPGYKTVVAPTTVLAAGQVRIGPTGNIEFFAAEATAAEVIYAAQDGSVFEETVNVAASAALFLSSKHGVTLLSATVLTSNIPAGVGAKVIDPRSAAPAAGEAALSIAGDGVLFAAADVVTGSATLRYIATPGVGGAPASIAARLSSLIAF